MRPKIATSITDKAQCYAKVIDEMNRECGPDNAIRHVNRKHLNNPIEADHGAMKQLLKPKRGFQSQTADVGRGGAGGSGHRCNGQIPAQMTGLDLA